MRRRVYSTILSNYFAASLEHCYVSVFLRVFASRDIGPEFPSILPASAIFLQPSPISSV